MNAIAYTILCWLLIKEAGPDSPLAIALGKDWKGKLSLVIYAGSHRAGLLNSWLGFGLYVVVAVIWFIPDRRIEKRFRGRNCGRR